MLSLDKAQISLVIAMRPCQPFPCIVRDARALSGCRMLLIPTYPLQLLSFRDAAPRLSGTVSTLHLRAFLSPLGPSDMGRERMGVHADAQARQELKSSTVTGGFATLFLHRDMLKRHLLLVCLQQ